jgi:hypothetical protein
MQINFGLNVMYSMNQAKTLAGVVTSQTNNETSFSEEVENNVSNSTLSVKEKIELFEKGTKQEPDLNTQWRQLKEAIMCKISL